MPRLFRYQQTLRRDPSVDARLEDYPGDLGRIAKHWFGVLRACGDDVHELLHDDHPTACVTDLGFAYVAVFTAHVNLGFFHGAELEDPCGILQGTGKFMRHVKLRPDTPVDERALKDLVDAAYVNMKARFEGRAPLD